MRRKILITSIGRGTKADENGVRSISGYRRAEYQWQDKQSFSTCYIADAMNHYFSMDGIFFLGTAGSDWASLYEYVMKDDKCTLKQSETEYDDNYLKNTLNLLADEKRVSAFASQMNDIMDDGMIPQYHHQLDTVKIEKALEPLQQAIAGCMDIILLKYGINRTEQMENMRALYRMEKLLVDGDELYIDLTHAFRSLQFFELVAISYFRKISCKRKKITIKMLSYGQLEANNEYKGISKIVDMSGLLNLMELINAAEQYRLFGTMHDVNTLSLQLQEEEEDILQRFGDAISINNIIGFEELITKGHELREKRRNEQGKVRHELNFLLDDVLSDIDTTFYKVREDTTKTQLNLAKWHFDHKRYLIAITTAQEAFITWGFILIGEKAKSYDQRDAMKNAIRNLGKGAKNNTVDFSIQVSFSKACDCRNSVAHPEDKQFVVKNKKEGIEKALVSLENSYNRFMKLSEVEKNTLGEKLKERYHKKLNSKMSQKQGK